MPHAGKLLPYKPLAAVVAAAHYCDESDAVAEAVSMVNICHKSFPSVASVVRTQGHWRRRWVRPRRSARSQTSRHWTCGEPSISPFQVSRNFLPAFAPCWAFWIPLSLEHNADAHRVENFRRFKLTHRHITVLQLKQLAGLGNGIRMLQLTYLERMGRPHEYFDQLEVRFPVLFLPL